MEPLPLKDIHLPETVNWWPPAPGWWLLAVLLPFLIIAVVYFYKTIRRQSALKTAGKLLAAIKYEDNQDSLQKLAALSALMRRVALSTAARTDVAALSGEAWLAYLDASFQDKPFSTGIGRCLADGHYRPTVPADADLDALFKLTERWLKNRKYPEFLLPGEPPVRMSAQAQCLALCTKALVLRGNNDSFILARAIAAVALADFVALLIECRAAN